MERSRCISVCAWDLTTTENFRMKTISPSNPLQFPSNKGLINKRRQGWHWKAAQRERYAYLGLVLTKRCTLTAARQGQCFATGPSTEQSSGRTPKERSEIKELLSIYQRRCWEGASTLKQNWDIFCLMTAIYNRAWMNLKQKSWEPINTCT